MRVAVLGLLLAAWAARAGETICAALIDSRTGEVEVHAVSRALGDELPNVQIEVDGDRTVRRSPLRRPYGKHRLRISIRGFASVDRESELRQSRFIVRAALEVGSLGGNCENTVGSVGGQISGGDGELWVKAVNGGYFLIEGLDLSDHILLVLRGNTVLHQQTVRPSLKQTNVRIDLSAKR